MSKTAAIARTLRLPKTTVVKALSHPLSVPVGTRNSVLNYAYAHGEDWIPKKFPTRLLVVTKKKDSSYTQEVYANLAKRYTELAVRLIRYDDSDHAWSEISAQCAAAPSCIVVLGETSRMLIDYLSSLNCHILYCIGSSVPPSQKLVIDYYGGAAALTEKLHKKGFKPYFAYNFQKTENVNEKLLGFLSTIHMLDITNTRERLIDLEKITPSASSLPSSAAIIAPDYATAQHLKQSLPDLVVACIELTVSVPNTLDILFATVLPNELAADIINTFASLLDGTYDHHRAVKVTPRFL